MIHTPLHASWLNQVEIVFSIVQKKVISPNDFASTAQLAATLLAFIDRYNQTARPFNWKFTAAGLTRLWSVPAFLAQDLGCQWTELPIS